MTIHLVGGFLGSGKTTAIAGAARLLASRGISAGVVTNDQGRSLVDTELVRSLGIPAAEVTGGCFCCNFTDFQKMVDDVAESARAAVVFAEPVGSCVDIVATVLKPAAAAGRRGWDIGRLSVLVDIRLMRQRLAGRALLFSRDVQYIFDSQIDEAEILVLNKSDLLGNEAAHQVLAQARERYPAKEVLLQSSLSPADLARWLETLGASHVPGAAPDVPGAPHASIPVDYERYTRGETAMAWYDASLSIDAPAGSAKEISRRLIDELRDSVRRRGRPVGHLKIHVRHEAGSFTTSITADDAAARGIEEAAGRHLDVTINARAEDTAAGLRAAMREGASRALSGDGITWKLSREDSFHPSPPRPFLRLP